MPNRENSTKIFISSTAQETLQPLRQKLKTILDASGHKALLFEDNFGLWTGRYIERLFTESKRS